jgi:UDP-N-acetylmuramyl pentapeptide phosphotransferase/UDP-N-acetylglucosamine-1-phosphate transferase/glycosyltransferase involved in cell wall biosynthesis
MIIFPAIFLGAACCVAVLTPLVGRLARAHGWVDHPGARKVHREPMPRVGGIAIYLAMLAGLVPAVAFVSLHQKLAPVHGPFLALAAAATFVFLVGLADDLQDISSKFKLITLLGATIGCWFAGIRIEVIELFGWSLRLGWFSFPVTLLWTVGITVGVNFLDGLDGLAAGICAVASAAIALVALGTGNVLMALVAFSLMGSLAGFLFFNFNPAKIFMGDCGSLFLGFVLATSAVACTSPGGVSHMMLPAAVLGVPIFDTVLTMVRRGVLQRRSLFSAERGHVHHRLIDMGLKHRDAVLVLYAVTLLTGLIGLFIHFSSHTVAEIVFGCALAATLLTVFGLAGSVKVNETIAAVRRNRLLGQEAKLDRRRFEEMQLRLKAAVDFNSWWHEVCSAAGLLGFARVELPLGCRDGKRRTLVWSSDVVETPLSRAGDVRADGWSGPSNWQPVGHGNGSFNGYASGNGHSNGNGNGNGNGKFHGNGNGDGNVHGNGNGNGNGNGHGNGHGHDPKLTLSGAGGSEQGVSGVAAGFHKDALCGDVPIRQRRAGQTLRASVAVRSDRSLESAGRRLALFVRLMGEHSVADIVEKPVARAPTGLSAGPGSNDEPLVFGEQANAQIMPVALPPNVRVAVLHDFLYCYGGAERVLEQILKVLPNADVYSLFDFLPEQHRGFLGGKTVRTSFIQKLPWARRKHRGYLPLMPLAIEQMDVSNYDVLVSSSYVAAKGAITRPDQLHVCYCHTPIRFAWDLQHQYLAESGLSRGIKSILARAVLHYIRNWDARSSNGVDAFVTNSNFVARRIQKFYRRKSMTIYPPVAVDKFSLQIEKEGFYLTASRLVPYKRVDLIAEAFSRMPHRRLIIVGEGPDFEKIKAKAGPNVKLVGHQPFERLRQYMQMASAFVFAAEEDFGIVPVEAQACGTPVIAYGRGGVTESVISGETGLFFNEQTVDSLVAAVEQFEIDRDAGRWDAARIRRHAERFSTERFREQFAALITHEWEAFRDTRLRQVAGVVGVRERNARRMARRERRLNRAKPETSGKPVLDQGAEPITAA